MDRDTVVSLSLALLALLSLGIAAATLDDPAAVEGQGSGGGGATGGGDATEGVPGGGGESGGLVPEPMIAGELPTVCFPWLRNLEVILSAIAVAVIVVAFARYDTGSWIPGIALVVSLGTPVVMLGYLLSVCGRSPPAELGIASGSQSDNSSIFPGGGAGGSSGATGTEAAISTPSLVLAVILGIALVGAVILLVVGTGDDREEPPEGEDEEPPAPDLGALGSAAGTAADRIEADADTDNAVYRAWVEMTGHLDVGHPGTSTPGEFADAAVDAGMDPDDVAELTAIFEAVRYGDAAVTEDREARAVAALRRVEEGYAE